MYNEIYVLLFLMQAPHYGYEIKKKLMDSAGACSTINNNVLYPILQKFETMGVASKAREEVEGKPSRIVYSITNIGRKLFVDNLQDFPDSLMDSREEFHTRLSFFSFLDKKTRTRVLDLRETYIASIRARAQRIDDKTNPFNPYKEVQIRFEEEVLQAEERLIQFFRSKVDDPRIIDENGYYVEKQLM